MITDYRRIEKPTLIINQRIALNNLKKMSEKARKSKVRFRPHFKTHQSAEIGEWYRSFGVSAITVSSVDMAAYFARHGWKDITIAFPLNIREIDKIVRLAARVRLNILVESLDVCERAMEKIKDKTGIWIKVDIGYGRAGIHHTDHRTVTRIAGKIQKNTRHVFQGLLTHAGNTYYARSPRQIHAIHQDMVTRLNGLRDRLYAAGIRDLKISIGDTPSCSIVKKFENIDEIRPGNFIFYDLQQLFLGSCTEKDIAVKVACPVVARHEKKREIVIYGGAVHFSKEFIPAEKGKKIFGLLTTSRHDGSTRIAYDCCLTSLSQEHGIVRINEGLLSSIHPGDIVYVIPVHSCLTAHQLKDRAVIDDGAHNHRLRSG